MQRMSGLEFQLRFLLTGVPGAQDGFQKSLCPWLPTGAEGQGLGLPVVDRLWASLNLCHGVPHPEPGTPEQPVIFCLPTVCPSLGKDPFFALLFSLSFFLPKEVISL